MTRIDDGSVAPGDEPNWEELDRRKSQGTPPVKSSVGASGDPEYAMDASGKVIDARPRLR